MEQSTSEKRVIPEIESNEIVKGVNKELKVVTEEASFEDKLPTPRYAVNPSFREIERSQSEVVHFVNISAESWRGFVCFELLDGDVLDLIGEFLGGGEVPPFAFTCRTLYRGLLEYKIENYALQEQMLKE